MIYLKEEDLNTLKEILRRYPYEFYAYGSRVKGTHQEYSDLDLCVMGDISDTELAQLKNELEKSNLPIKIDLAVYNTIREDIKKLIQNDLQSINI